MTIISTPRHREEIILDEHGTCALRTKIGSNGSCTVPAGVPTNAFGLSVNGNTSSHISREMDDVVTTNFKKLMAQGVIINNPMSSEYNEVTIPSSHVQLNWDWTVYGCTPPRRYVVNHIQSDGPVSMASMGGTGVLPFTRTFDIEAMSDLAISRAWSNIGSHEMLAMATLAEANQSVQGLIWLFKKAARIVKAVKRKQLARLKREITWKEMQEVYMNARYNLRPLAYDIKGILAIMNKSGETPKRQTFRAKEEDIELITGSYSVPFTSAYGLIYTMNFSQVSYQTALVRAGVLTSVDPTEMAQLFGLDRVFETLWDLMPYSFIVDWFFNVGDVLSAWVPVKGFTALASWVTTYVVQSQSVTLTSMTNNSPATYGGALIMDVGSTATDASYVVLKVVKTRVPNYSRPILPTFNLKLDPLKLLDLAIIIRNMKHNASYVR